MDPWVTPNIKNKSVLYAYASPDLIKNLPNLFDMMKQGLVINVLKKGKVYYIGQKQIVQLIADSGHQVKYSKLGPFL